MMSRQPGPGELAAGAGGLLLLLAMLLPWFGMDASFVLPGSDEAVTVDDRSLSAWQAFGWVDLVLAMTAALAIGLVLVPERRRSEVGLALTAFAALSALLIVVRLFDPPNLELPDVAGGVTLEVGRRLGAFFGLLCAAAIAWGANRATIRAPAEPAAPEPEPWPHWTRGDIDQACGRAWRSYDRRLSAHYTAYFDRHPELRGDGRFAARDARAALPP